MCLPLMCNCYKKWNTICCWHAFDHWPISFLQIFCLPGGFRLRDLPQHTVFGLQSAKMCSWQVLNLGKVTGVRHAAVMSLVWKTYYQVRVCSISTVFSLDETLKKTISCNMSVISSNKNFEITYPQSLKVALETELNIPPVQSRIAKEVRIFWKYCGEQ